MNLIKIIFWLCKMHLKSTWGYRIISFCFGTYFTLKVAMFLAGFWHCKLGLSDTRGTDYPGGACRAAIRVGTTTTTVRKPVNLVGGPCLAALLYCCMVTCLYLGLFLCLWKDLVRSPLCLLEKHFRITLKKSICCINAKVTSIKIIP